MFLKFKTIILSILLVSSMTMAFDPNDPLTASNIGFSHIFTHINDKVFKLDPVTNFIVVNGFGLLWEMRHPTGVDPDELMANAVGCLSYQFVVTIGL